ncbi:MAG: 4-hydroxy-tetrahydrodipicolinate synthase [Dethiobacteraceae bacterium]
MVLIAPFGEMITAMATPFFENGEINYEKAAELAAFLVDNGTDGIVVCGTTGESPTLAEEEKKELFSVTVAAVKGKAKILAGTGSNNTIQTIRLTKIAENCGVDGIMLVVPYYNKPPQEGLFRHFSAIAAQTALPVMLYNVPGRTVVNMTAETTLRLAQVSNIVAVKEASGDLEQVARIRAGAPDNFAVYSGDDSMTLPVLAVGGIGVVSVVSHIAGREIKQMISAFKNGDTETAVKTHLKLLPLVKAMFITTSPTPLKGAMNMLGHNLGPVRLPLVELTENQHEEIADVLTGLGYL